MEECLNTFLTAVKGTFTLAKTKEEELLDRILSNDRPIPPELFRKYAENLMKAVRAVPMGGNGQYLSEQWQANVARFAAYKTYCAAQDIRRIADEEGGDMDYIKAVFHSYNRWQAAEYNTAVARARTGKQWQQFSEDDNVRLFPNIKWLPSRSATPREEHMPFYNCIWPKDDPFWTYNQPGTLWNCKCDWEQTDEAPTDDNPTSKIVHKGLHGNPAETGQLFTEDVEHPENNYSYVRRAPRHIDIGYATQKEFPSLQSLLDVDLTQYRLDHYTLDGGFLQTSRKRIKEGQMNKQEKEKFGKEYSMCRTLASNDFNVTYRESVQGSYDVTLNGIPTELKKVDSSKQIYRHARKAFEEQGAKAVVIEIATLDAEAWQQLNKIKAKGWKCYYYTSSERKVVLL